MVEGVAKAAAEYYITNGVLGVSVLVLAITVVILWRKLEDLRKEKDAVQEARIREAKECADTRLQSAEEWSEFKEKLLGEIEERRTRRNSGR